MYLALGTANVKAQRCVWCIVNKRVTASWIGKCPAVGQGPKFADRLRGEGSRFTR